MKKKITLFALSLMLGSMLFVSSVNHIYAGASIGNQIRCGPGDEGISTAIGCINMFGDGATDYTGNSFLQIILRWAIGIGGGIALLLILYAGFMIMTASGNPERIKAGQEMLTSAIAGLILLIFSIYILKVVGVDILGLCKFGFGTCPS